MSLNWSNLVAQGRARDIGIPWSEDEQLKLANLQVEGHSRTDAASILRGTKPRKELEAEAKAAGVDFTPEATDTVLENTVRKVGKKNK